MPDIEPGRVADIHINPNVNETKLKNILGKMVFGRLFKIYIQLITDNIMLCIISAPASLNIYLGAKMSDPCDAKIQNHPKMIN